MKKTVFMDLPNSMAFLINMHFFAEDSNLKCKYFRKCTDLLNIIENLQINLKNYVFFLENKTPSSPVCVVNTWIY